MKLLIVRMKLAALIIFFAFCFSSRSDTLINITTGDILNGYVTSRTNNGGVWAHTIEEGFTQLNLSDWDVAANNIGRNNKIIVIELAGPFDLQIVTEAVTKAIVRAADEGPLFVLLEIDSPGGRAAMAESICDTIIRTKHCPIYAYVKSGICGGALSTAAAVALACDKICMAPDTIIGAALITTVGVAPEKLSVAWQQYLQSLACHSGKPGLLARAMVDKDVEVIEVKEKNKRSFIVPSQRGPDQSVVRTWSKKGSLLTLTAAEAVESGLAEGIAPSRDVLMRGFGVASAEVVIDDGVTEAARTFKKAKLKFDRLRNSLDAQIKKVEQTENLAQAIILLRQIKDDYKSLLLLAKRFPDLYLDIELIEEQLDSANLYYEKAKDKHRQLDFDAPVSPKPQK